MRETNELIHQACQQIQSLNDFFQLGQDCLPVVLEVTEFLSVSGSRYQHYVIPFLQESSHYLRPINESLFIRDVAQFSSRRNQFQGLIGELRDSRGNLDSLSHGSRGFADGDSIVRLLYTVVQSIGGILDLAPNPQTARKNFGQRFEDFVKVLLSDLGIANDAFTFRVENPAINARYNVPIDIIMNTHEYSRSPSFVPHPHRC